MERVKVRELFYISKVFDLELPKVTVMNFSWYK